MPIKQLSDHIINQIAAGEVVSRPASVVKELIENAIDAKAKHIEIIIENGGKSLIQVLDDGQGIPQDELPLAISRHCTSKMTQDIHNIQALGFRGEALPSIASVSKLKIISYHYEASMAAEIKVEGGRIFPVQPASFRPGTLVEVRDLFYIVPARLKFMKSERAEITAIQDTVKRLALAYPDIYFLLRNKQKKLLEYFAQKSDDADLHRIREILGEEFLENCAYFSYKNDQIDVSGYCSIPSYNCGNGLWQFCYINERPIHDKLVLHAIRSAYMDFIPRDRYPYLVLFIKLSPYDVDVNVHPTKADVRFRDPQFVRSFIIRAIKSGLEDAPLKAATIHGQKMQEMFISEDSQTETLNTPYKKSGPLPQTPWLVKKTGPNIHLPIDLPLDTPTPQPKQLSANFNENSEQNPLLDNINTNRFVPDLEPKVEEQEETNNYPLGMARAQIHKNYIISQTKDSLILIDQHAAHERLVYEALKDSLYGKNLPSQMLLLPKIVNLRDDESTALLEHKQELQKFGLNLEEFGSNAIIVRETPLLLGDVDVEKLIKDLAHEVMEYSTVEGLKTALNRIASTMACHGSVRSGRLLKIEEMNALLRAMEKVPQSKTCNHGRPTYIELKLQDIEKLFKRR